MIFSDSLFVYKLAKNVRFAGPPGENSLRCLPGCRYWTAIIELSLLDCWCQAAAVGWSACIAGTPQIVDI